MLFGNKTIQWKQRGLRLFFTQSSVFFQVEDPNLYIKGAKKIGKKFRLPSNERHLSGDTGTILEYTNVTGPNQSGSSWD